MLSGPRIFSAACRVGRENISCKNSFDSAPPLVINNAKAADTLNLILVLSFILLLRAADWKLDAPDWTGRLRIVAKGKDITLKLEDRDSGKLDRI